MSQGQVEQFVVLEKDGVMWPVCACGWEGPKNPMTWARPFADGNAHVEACTTEKRFRVKRKPARSNRRPEDG